MSTEGARQNCRISQVKGQRKYVSLIWQGEAYFLIAGAEMSGDFLFVKNQKEVEIWKQS